MIFNKYPSIENHYREQFISKCRDVAGEDGWIATEKVHGCNLSFWYDGSDFKVGSRNQFIDDLSSFYRCGEVVESIKEKILTNYTKDLSNMVIFGELYGSGIQSGMSYSSDEKSFLAFDISVNENFLPYSECVSIMEDFTINTVPHKGTGSLDDLLSIDVDSMKSCVGPDEYNFRDGIVEGIVIRPYHQDYYLPSGSRVIIKKKSAGFSNKPNYVPRKNKLQVNGAQKELIETALTFASKHAVESALSKHPNFYRKDIGKMIGICTQEILGDINNALGIDLKSELSDAWKPFLSELTSNIKPHILEKSL